MRHKRALLFLLTGVVVWPLAGQMGGITAAKRRAATEVESRGRIARTRTAGRGISESRKSRLAETYGKLPMRFEANQGQTDANVKFLARGAGYRLFLTGNDAVIALRKPLAIGSSSASRADGFASTSLHLRFLGTSSTTGVVGMEKLPGQSNYFVGNDPRQWRTQVPAYAKVGYKGIYPGIDLIYHGNQSHLEYDFVAPPGADVSAISMEVIGLRSNLEK